MIIVRVSKEAFLGPLVSAVLRFVFSIDEYIVEVGDNKIVKMRTWIVVEIVAANDVWLQEWAKILRIDTHRPRKLSTSSC